MSSGAVQGGGSWRRVIGLLCLIGILGLVALAGINVYMSRPCHPNSKTTVRMPGPEAAPDQVVLTFLDAIDVGDYTTAKAMLAPSQWFELQTPPWYEPSFAPSYLGNICRVSGTTVDSIATEPSWASGQQAFRELVQVQVTYDLELKHTDPLDEGGKTTDRYTLGRNANKDPWTITCARCHG